ncbi:MAG: hypothetical protein NVS2B3_03470 [Vulcanimicrobiaceae bacterium]
MEVNSRANSEGVAPKVMSRHVRGLEADGLVTRTAYAEVPPRVEYASTEAGAGLVPILDDLERRGVANRTILSPTITGDDPARSGAVDAHHADAVSLGVPSNRSDDGLESRTPLA